MTAAELHLAEHADALEYCYEVAAALATELECMGIRCTIEHGGGQTRIHPIGHEESTIVIQYQYIRVDRPSPYDIGPSRSAVIEFRGYGRKDGPAFIESDDDFDFLKTVASLAAEIRAASERLKQAEAEHGETFVASRAAVSAMKQHYKKIERRAYFNGEEKCIEGVWEPRFSLSFSSLTEAETKAILDHFIGLSGDRSTN